MMGPNMMWTIDAEFTGADRQRLDEMLADDQVGHATIAAPEINEGQWPFGEPESQSEIAQPVVEDDVDVELRKLLETAAELAIPSADFDQETLVETQPQPLVDPTPTGVFQLPKPAISTHTDTTEQLPNSVADGYGLTVPAEKPLAATTINAFDIPESRLSTEQWEARWLRAYDDSEHDRARGGSGHPINLKPFIKAEAIMQAASKHPELQAHLAAAGLPENPTTNDAIGQIFDYIRIGEKFQSEAVVARQKWQESSDQFTTVRDAHPQIDQHLVTTNPELLEKINDTAVHPDDRTVMLRKVIGSLDYRSHLAATRKAQQLAAIPETTIVSPGAVQDYQRYLNEGKQNPGLQAHLNGYNDDTNVDIDTWVENFVAYAKSYVPPTAPSTEAQPIAAEQTRPPARLKNFSLAPIIEEVAPKTANVKPTDIRLPLTNLVGTGGNDKRSAIKHRERVAGLSDETIITMYEKFFSGQKMDRNATKRLAEFADEISGALERIESGKPAIKNDRVEYILRFNKANNEEAYSEVLAEYLGDEEVVA